MSASALVAAARRAVALVRDAREAVIVGAAFAVTLDGRRALVTDDAVAARVEAGEARLLSGLPAEVVARDPVLGVGLLAFPDGADLEPLLKLAVAPLPDGEDLLVTGSGARVQQGADVRHLWVTRACLLAGRVHALDPGARAPDLSYLLDLAPDLMPPGCPVLRREDGAVAALVASQAAPGPSLTLARPIREAVALIETLPPGA